MDLIERYDRVTDRHFLNLVTPFDDPPREFQPWRVRKGNRKPGKSTPQIDVGVLHGAEFDRHDDILRARNGLRNILKAEHCRLSKLVETNCLHDGDGSALTQGHPSRRPMLFAIAGPFA
jgi:hypothetical protein